MVTLSPNLITTKQLPVNLVDRVPEDTPQSGRSLNDTICTANFPPHWRTSDALSKPGEREIFPRYNNVSEGSVSFLNIEHFIYGRHERTNATVFGRDLM